MLMDQLTEEELADRFYMAEAWLARQAELVCYLLDLKHVVLASHAIQAINQHIDAWEYKPGLQVELMQTYMAARAATQRRFRDYRM